MLVRDETMDITDAGRIYEFIKGDSDCDILDAGRIYEIFKGDSYCYILDAEELKDNAWQLHLRALAESKKKLPGLVGIKQNRHYINVRNRL